MKLEKKHCIIIGVVVAIILVWYFFLRKKKTESGYRASGSERHPWCPPGTTWRNGCACCVPDNPSERTNNSPVGIKPVISQVSSMSPSHPKCKPGTTWSDTAAMCIPDTPENIKWPPWLKIGIKRVCPQGFVLDPVTKGCVRAWDL